MELVGQRSCGQGGAQEVRHDGADGVGKGCTGWSRVGQVRAKMTGVRRGFGSHGESRGDEDTG